ncbi:MAG: formylglycine-generating enzyme family protein [Parahaliea sp.]
MAAIFFYFSVKHQLSSHQALYVLKVRSGLFEQPMVPEMQPIAAGSFDMGSNNGDSDEQRAHPVTLAAFEMGRYEVTFAEYDIFAEAFGHRSPTDRGWGRDRQPVIDVSWDDAQAYARWLGLVTDQSCGLPTEAEWEYAARAGMKTNYSWGDEIGQSRANCDGCGSEWDNKQTAPVGSFAPNPWGLYDMHGNVWEWVQDCWHGSYEGAPADGSAWLEENGGDCTGRVLCGGSWNFNPFILRAAPANFLALRPPA